MISLEDIITKKAKQYNFQLLTNSPEKLASYIVEEIISPVSESILTINKDFYDLKREGNETVIKIVNENFYIRIEENELKVLKDYDDGFLLVLNVIFEDSYAYNNDNNEQKKPLTESDLYFSFEKAYN